LHPHFTTCSVTAALRRMRSFSVCPSINSIARKSAPSCRSISKIVQIPAPRASARTPFRF
jgi:hypothetical protein